MIIVMKTQEIVYFCIKFIFNMKNILVPIGSSENSSNTLQYAIDFAAAINAEVYVFRAYNVLSRAGTIINLNDIIERETNLYLRSVIKSVDVKNVSIKIITAKGKPIDSIVTVDNELGIDLIILGPRSNTENNEVFLGNTSGGIVKKTVLPTLIVPENYTFKPFTNILMAFKSGVINNTKKLIPITILKNTFNSKLNLLLVKTPEHTEKDLVINEELENLKSSLTITENATTFQGVLANFNTLNPDALVVLRRKRGFFKKLWEKNIILKKEFSCNVPVIVLG